MTPREAYNYAKDIIQGRWPEGEPTDPGWSYCYARDTIQGRWPEGEPIILTDHEIYKKYIKLFDHFCWQKDGF